MIMKMLTHMHMVMYTWWCQHICKRGVACEAGFGAFMEVKCIFSTTPVAEIFSKSSWIETEANESH
jgi:hypothetical protein